MKIIVTGSLGHISRPLAEELLEKGHHVTVVSSNSERQKDIEPAFCDRFNYSKLVFNCDAEHWFLWIEWKEEGWN